MKRITILTTLLITSLTISQNLLINGDFETGSTDDGWLNSTTGALYSYATEAVMTAGPNGEVLPYDGNYFGRKTGSSNNFIQVVNVEENKTYIVSYWHQLPPAQETKTDVARIRVVNTDDSQGDWLVIQAISNGNLDATDNTKFRYEIASGDLTNSTGGWVQSKFSFTVPAGVTRIRTNFWANGNRFFDNVVLEEESTASNNETALFNFSYAPNPVTNTLSLNAARTISKVEFFNTLGQRTLTIPVNALSSTINLSELNKGMYIMNVAIEDQIQAFRILKQ